MLVLHDVNNVLISSCPHIADIMIWCSVYRVRAISLAGPVSLWLGRVQWCHWGSLCILHVALCTKRPWHVLGGQGLAQCHYFRWSVNKDVKFFLTLYEWGEQLLYSTFTLGFSFFLSTGMMIGGYFWGSLADRHGRRTVLLGSLTVNGLGGLVSSTSQVFWLFLLARFISGIG